MMAKKWLAGFLAMVMLLAVGLSGLAVTAGGTLYGDVNEDTSVDMKDVLVLRRYLAHMTASLDEQAADVNLDDSIDMKDVLLIRKYIARIVDHLGGDPSPAESSEPSVTTAAGDVTTTTAGDVTTTAAGDVTTTAAGDVTTTAAGDPTATTAAEPTTTTAAATTTTKAQEERPNYVYGDDGEPYINFIADPNCSLGVWWWYTEDGENTTLRDKYLNFLEANGATQIYYYCAYDLQSSGGRTTTHNFVAAAKEHGMTVAPILDDYDMAGNKSYATGELAGFTRGYLAYQDTYPDAPLAGFHCDIEPHQMNGANAPLDTLRPEQLQSYVDSFIDALQSVRKAGIPVEVDLNCQWNSYGGADVTYGGYTGVYNVIAHYVDSMCLMAYRDTAKDILALGDVAFAAAKDAGTRLVFAVETGAYSFNQPYEEFAQENKEYMYDEFAKVYATLEKDHPAGGYGLAVHQHRTWYSLEKAAAQPTTTKSASTTTKSAVTTTAAKPTTTTKKATTTTAKAPTTTTTKAAGNTAVFEGNVSANLTLAAGAYYENEAITQALQRDTAANGLAKQYLITVNGSASPSDLVYPILLGANGMEAWPIDGNYRLSTNGTITGTIDGGEFSAAGDEPVQLYFYAENGRSSLSITYVKIEAIRGGTPSSQTTAKTTAKTTVTTGAQVTTTTRAGGSTTRTTIGTGAYTYVDGVPYITFRSYGDEGTLGTWWWNDSEASNATTCTNYLNFLYKNGVDEIYFYGYYWCEGNKTALHTFVQKANAKGMAVSLIYDDADTIAGSSNTEMNRIANNYLAYCSAYPGDIMAGIHFDIESGMSRANMAKNMISQFPAARARGVKIAIDVNCGWFETVTCNGVTDTFMNIAAANVDCLSLMSYRDTADAIWSLGSRALTSAKTYGTKIVFGVETGRFEFNSDNVEFSQEGKEVCYTELAKVFAKLKNDHPSGGYGIAVHAVDWWYKLKNK